MQLTAKELKELLGTIKEVTSIDIKVRIKSSMDDELLCPIKIADREITHLGIYDINGIKFWIIKK